MQVLWAVSLTAINSFLIDDKAFADSITTILKSRKEQRTKKLIIDIRHNGGGSNENVLAPFACSALAPFWHLWLAEILGHPPDPSAQPNVPSLANT